MVAKKTFKFLVQHSQFHLQSCGWYKSRRTAPWNDWQLTINQLLVKIGFIIWHFTPSCCFLFLLLCLPVFVPKHILETSTFLFSLLSFSMTFSFFLFSSSILTENLQKICHIFMENILWKKTFMNPLWRHFIARTKRAILSRRCLARSGSQLHCRIWFILPAHRASHYYNYVHKISKCFIKFSLLAPPVIKM